MYVPRGFRRLKPFPVFSPHRQSRTTSTPSGEILRERKRSSLMSSPSFEGGMLSLCLYTQNNAATYHIPLCNVRLDFSVKLTNKQHKSYISISEHKVIKNKCKE